MIKVTTWEKLFATLPEATWEEKDRLIKKRGRKYVNDWAHKIATRLCKENGLNPDQWDDYLTLAIEIEFA